VLFTIASLACAGTARVGQLDVDYASFLSRNDIVYLSPAREGWEGLPLGNGRFGAQVWQPDGLAFHLNTPLSGVYGGAIARLRLTAEPGMLTGLRSYRQRLSLHDATLTTRSEHTNGTVEVTAFIAAESDVLVLDVADTRPGAVHRVELETWRKTAHTRVENGVLILTDKLICTGEPDYRLALAVDLRANGQVQDGERNTLETRDDRYRIIAAFAAARDAETDVAAAALARLKDLRDVRKTHEEWWRRFWAKSLIHLHSDDSVADYLENLWYVHLYAMACGSRGEVPPKFNGGLWTHNRDEREWGAAYWHWNTQETCWPLFAANHLELHEPYQRMYFGMLPEVCKWTKEMYGLDGAQFQETIPFNGRMGKWPTVRGVHPRVPVAATFAHTNMILSSSAEIAMQFWWAWLYTGDKAFLRERAYPLMKEVALFYLGYLEKDAQGRYVVWPSNAHETFWRVKNPATDLAAITYLLLSMRLATWTLGCDPELGDRCWDTVRRLTLYPTDPKTGAILAYEPQPNEKIEVSNAENPEMFPIGVFPIYTLNTPTEDKTHYERALRTFRARRHVNTYGWTTDSICAARLGIADDAASQRLFPDWTPKDSKGWGIERLLPNHAETYQVYPCGLMDYYPRNPGMHCYLEGSGTFSTACGEMLLQSWDGLIRVAPALPRAWEAKFTLLAMGGFLVTAEVERGRVLYVAIESQRQRHVSIANPFNEPAEVNIDGRGMIWSGFDPIHAFIAEPGHVYYVVPKSRPDVASNRPVVSGTRNDAPRPLPPSKKRWLGKLPLPTLGNKPAEANPPRPPAVPASIEPPSPFVIDPVRADSAPKIDGQLDEPVWSIAKPIGHFAVGDSLASAKEPTEARLACDKQALYVAITAWESQMECQLAGEPVRRDQPVELEDSVSILLRPLGQASAWWCLAVNPLGARYDALCSGARRTEAADPGWNVAVRRWSNRWTIEAALPYSALAPAPPGPGAPWDIRIERREMPRGERSAFPVGGGSFVGLRLREGAAAIQPQAVEPGLVGYWPGEIANGVWVRDQSGNGLHGLVVGNVKEAEGKVGKGLALNGGYVEVPDCPRLNVKDGLTLMAWVWPEQVGSMRLMDKAPVGRDNAFLFDTHPENHLRFITRFGGLGTKDAIPARQWTHVAATFDGLARRIYINGELKAEAGSMKQGALDTTDLPLRFGADSEGGSRFHGVLDEIRIYDRALSADDIRRVAGIEKR
jgi:hypothetical protein